MNTVIEIDTNTDYTEENTKIFEKVDIELPIQIARFKEHIFQECDHRKWAVFIDSELVRLFDDEIDACRYGTQQAIRLSKPSLVNHVGQANNSYCSSKIIV
jgi:hypothetical protein